MAKLIVFTWDIFVLGKGHWGQTIATVYKLTKHQVGSCRDDGKLTKEGVERWLMSNSGDFQSITDWKCSLGDELETEFDSQDNADIFSEIWYGEEE